MSNYVECGNKIAFHPGYYIKEYIDNKGLNQEDFANRLGTTPKNISYIVRGEQSISVDIAMKLSRMIGTTVKYWLNLQAEFDSLIAEFSYVDEDKKEREVFNTLSYAYFRDNYGLPDISKKIDEQIKQVREFLNVSSLNVFKNTDMYVRFRSAALKQLEPNLIKSNIMVQIATNISLNASCIPNYNKKNFEKAIEYALTLTKNHDGFYDLIKERFYQAGVNFIVLPNISGSKINGATKRIGDHVMLMVNDRNSFSDSFWFTLFHEIGHIINGDFGVSFENECGKEEEIANHYAEECLIPSNEYQQFIENGDFTIDEINSFANKINRDPGIILGRLRNDKRIRYDDVKYNCLRTRYRIKNKLV